MVEFKNSHVVFEHVVVFIGGPFALVAGIQFGQVLDKCILDKNRGVKFGSGFSDLVEKPNAVSGGLFLLELGVGFDKSNQRGVALTKDFTEQQNGRGLDLVPLGDVQVAFLVPYFFI